MPRLPAISKYCVLRVDGAFGRIERVDHAHAFDRLLLDAVDHARRLDPRRLEDRRHDVDDVMELAADTARILDVTRPRNSQALPRSAKVRCDLLRPFERRVECPRPGDRHVRIRRRRTPVLEVQQLQGFRHVEDAVVRGHLVERARERAFGARPVVAVDVDDQRVVELAHVLDRLDHAAYLVVGIGGIGGEYLGLARIEFFLEQRKRVPMRQLRRPRRELGIGRDHAQPLLVGEDLVAQFFPAHVELALEFLDPLLCRLMGRVSCRPGT